jgi:hypothetical protein
MRKKAHAEEQLAQIVNLQIQNFQAQDTFRMSHELIARLGVELVKGWENVAGVLGVDAKTLRNAREDPMVKRLLLTPNGRARLDLETMTDLDWNYLQTALILRARGNERKSAVARNRPRQVKGQFAG